MPFCPVCKYEYVTGTSRCPDCDVDLVDRLEDGGNPAGGSGADEGLALVFQTPNRAEAAVMEDMLRASGISVLEQPGVAFYAGLMDNEQTVRIYVPRFQAEDAMRLIDETSSKSMESMPTDEPSARDDIRKAAPPNRRLVRIVASCILLIPLLTIPARWIADRREKARIREIEGNVHTVAAKLGLDRDPGKAFVKGLVLTLGTYKAYWQVPDPKGACDIGAEPFLGDMILLPGKPSYLKHGSSISGAAIRYIELDIRPTSGTRLKMAGMLGASHKADFPGFFDWAVLDLDGNHNLSNDPILRWCGNTDLLGGVPEYSFRSSTMISLSRLYPHSGKDRLAGLDLAIYPAMILPGTGGVTPGLSVPMSVYTPGMEVYTYSVRPYPIGRQAAIMGRVHLRGCWRGTVASNKGKIPFIVLDQNANDRYDDKADRVALNFYGRSELTPWSSYLTSHTTFHVAVPFALDGKRYVLRPTASGDALVVSAGH